MNDQIPIGCALNVAIISKIAETAPFVDACTEVPLEHNIKPPREGLAWPFQNMSWYAYMLYCMLVVPKEIYKSIPDTDVFYAAMINDDIMRGFTIRLKKYSFSQNPKYHFASLRNSVSHVNYSMSADNILTMWDHPPGKPAQRHWEASITLPELGQFLNEIANATVKIYNDIQSGVRAADGTIQHP